LSDAPEFKTKWLRNIVAQSDRWMPRSSDFPIAFLLSLLTNIESLILPAEWHGLSVPGEEGDEVYRSVSDLIHLLVTRANDTGLTHQPLQKLHTLYPTRHVDEQSRLERIWNTFFHS
jgi:hypothetical protein